MAWHAINAQIKDYQLPLKIPQSDTCKTYSYDFPHISKARNIVNVNSHLLLFTYCEISQ